MRFNNPLPIPSNAVALTDDEKVRVQKYMERIEAHNRQIETAREALNDICMSIAARAGNQATSFSLSADLGCLIPKET